MSYLHRWLQNFTVTDNRSRRAADFTEFSVTAPLDPRLPGGGGYVVPASYDVDPDKFGVTDNYRTYSPAYGNISQVYNGVDFTVNARLRNGLQLQGGTQHRPAGHRLLRGARPTARTSLSRCVLARGNRVRSSEPVLSCRTWGHDTRATLAGTYIIPKIDVQFASYADKQPRRTPASELGRAQCRRATVAGS